MTRHRNLMVIAALIFAVSLPAFSASGWRSVQTPTKGKPTPCKIVIDDLSVYSKGQEVIKETFDRTGVFQPETVKGISAENATYLVRMGDLGGKNVTGSTLTITDADMIELWAAGSDWQGDSTYGALFSIPTDANGSATFAGREMFGDLVYSATIDQPRLQGYEKLTLGLSDAAAYRPVVKLSYRKDQIYLERVRPPAKRGDPTQEILLDKIDMSAFPTPDRVRIALKVDASGTVSAIAQVTADNKTTDFSLTPVSDEAKVDPAYAFYTLSVFAETMPMPTILNVTPATITAASLRHKKEPVTVEIKGRGFCPDAKVEVIPADEPGAGKAKHAVEVVGVNLLKKSMSLQAMMRFNDLKHKDYSIRLTTGGQTAILDHAIHLE